MKNSHRENSIQALSEAKSILKELKEDPKAKALKQFEELEFWGIETDVLYYPENKSVIDDIKKSLPEITNEELVKEFKKWLSSQS